MPEVAARNSYVPGDPVGDGPAFVGRIDVLRSVLRVLRHDRQNAIVLFGQRRIGKTSILQRLKVWLPRKVDFFPVQFDFADKAALQWGACSWDRRYRRTPAASPCTCLAWSRSR
jgi:hypothetical protein